MSLMLRKLCEEVLEAAGLGDYHARVSDDNTLSVVGPCGKPLFSISGIKFSRSTPNHSEISYASTLLQEFCTEHSQAITDTLRCKAELAVAKKPEPVERFSVSSRNRRAEYTVSNNIDLLYEVDTGSLLLQSHGHSTYDTSPEDLKFLASPKLRSDMKKVFDDFNRYYLLEQAYDTAIAALTSCDI